MTNRRRCDLHGGKTPRGIASPHYKHGRFSQVAPARMLSAYQDAPQDPQLLATRDLAAVAMARLHELLRQVDDGASRSRIRRLRHLARQYDRAAADDRAGIWTELRQGLDAAADDWSTWREIDHVVQMFLKAAARERQRLLDLEALVTGEEAAAFGAAVIGVIRRHVTDRDVLEAMQADLTAIYEARMRAE